MKIISQAEMDTEMDIAFAGLTIKSETEMDAWLAEVNTWKNRWPNSSFDEDGCYIMD
jgi:hypothetical protein